MNKLTLPLEIELKQCDEMAAMVAENEWAEHVGTGPVSSKVEEAFTKLHNELSEARELATHADAGELAVILRQTQVRHRAKVERLRAELAGSHALLLEIHNWLVCAAIVTPEDMAQSFSSFQEAIAEVLPAKAPKCKHCGDTGQFTIGNSGDPSDGNAPIMERCEDCELGQPNKSKCGGCKPTDEESALLNAGEYTPEELWGGSRPTCPDCISVEPVEPVYWNKDSPGNATDVKEISPRQLDNLRLIRFHHWEMMSQMLTLANQVVSDPTLKGRYNETAEYHQRIVHAMNDFFPAGDTADKPHTA